MSKNSITPETEAFVLDNLHFIKEMILLKNTVVKSFQEECLSFLTDAFAYSGYEVRTTLNHWEGFPAIRFSFSHWLASSDVVLFLDRTPGKRFEIRTYVCDLMTTELFDRAKKLLKVSRYDHHWDERGGKILVVTSYINGYQDDKTFLFKNIADRMVMLDKFEEARRDQHK